MADEAKLVEKLQKIEALWAGAATDGERIAAGRARERIREKIRSLEREDPPREFRFRLRDIWSHRLFLALLRRYDLEPYRYKGQHRTTVMVRAPGTFVDETLWPEFTELDETLADHLSAVTDEVISRAFEEEAEPPVVQAGRPAAG